MKNTVFFSSYGAIHFEPRYRVLPYNMKKYPFFQSLKSPNQNDEFQGKNTLFINFRARLEESDKICSFFQVIFFSHPNSKGKKGGTDKIRVLWQKLMQKHSKFHFFFFFCIFVKFSMYFTNLGRYMGGFGCSILAQEAKQVGPASGPKPFFGCWYFKS